MIPTMRVESQDLVRLAKRLSVSEPIQRRWINRFLQRTTARLQSEWARMLGKAPHPRFTGEAAASIQRRVVIGRGQRVSFDGRVFTPKIHGAVLEAGRKPGSRMPPINAIARWVHLREQRGDLDIPDQFWPKTPDGQQRAKAVRRFAYVVARSIAVFGIKGKRFARRALRKNRRKIRQELAINTHGMLREVVSGRR